MIGYVSQKAVLFSGTVTSNIAFGDNGKGTIHAEDVQEAVLVAQATEFIERMNGTYDAPIAQRISTIKDADQILVLDHGKIVGKGTHKELLQNCPEYLEIAQSQLSKEEIENG